MDIDDLDVSDLLDSAQRMAGFSGIFNIAVSVACIWLTWWALQGFRLDVFMKNPKSPQAKLLQILLSVAIGYTAASFIIDYMAWSLLLKGLV